MFAAPVTAKRCNLCPKCGKALTADQMNLAEGVALCPGCGELSRLSDVAGSLRLSTGILRRPPRGCWIRDRGDEIVVHASLRSFAGFLGVLLVTLFWNGLVSIFVLSAVQGLYVNLVGPVPAWFPGPEMDEPQTLGGSIFLCVFLIPFVLIGLLLGGFAIMCAFGKVEARLSGMEAQVRTGTGPFVWRRRFDPAAVEGIEVRATNAAHAHETIVIAGDTTVEFGGLLTDERRDWMRAALYVLLLIPSSHLAEQLLESAAGPSYQWHPAEKECVT